MKRNIIWTKERQCSLLTRLLRIVNRGTDRIDVFVNGPSHWYSYLLNVLKKPSLNAHADVFRGDRDREY